METENETKTQKKRKKMAKCLSGERKKKKSRGLWRACCDQKGRCKAKRQRRKSDNRAARGRRRSSGCGSSGAKCAVHRKALAALAPLSNDTIRPLPKKKAKKEEKEEQKKEEQKANAMAHATRIKMPSGDTIDIKALIGEPECSERLHRVPLRVYTVSCDDILFRTCIGATADAGSDDGNRDDSSDSSSSLSSWSKQK
ncbi:hypothetical protein TW95_gp1650 [Pandoravirus inopinatum]|uniref:Uncharacterized protein n=1 Tax=Pandoravirus inopinatum TaxID=1605721 RepID=A0A0B5J436_9VIRU|nr:hypothetical protein TW95_gp1650 [Pandoravirus inopinatum]AJF98384.1 hypothetical protein [Pandoravirus inopinatum]